MSRNDQINYPKFAELVRNLSSYVQNNQNVMKALLAYSGFSATKIKELIKFDSGPIVSVTETNEKWYGNYDKTTQTLQIKASWVRGLENANLATTEQATAFLLAVTVLHEFVHYGRDVTKLGERINGIRYEFGQGFEVAAFGAVIGAWNASEYSYKFYKYD